MTDPDGWTQYVGWFVIALLVGTGGLIVYGWTWEQLIARRRRSAQDTSSNTSI